MTFRHLIWDMGGTLIDTYPSIHRALRDVLADSGATVPLDEIAALTSATSIAEAILTLARQHAVDADALTSAYESVKSGWSAEPPVLLPGAAELMSFVRARGGKNVVVTHRDRESAERLLAATGLEIDDLICASDGHPRKPDPRMHELALERNRLDPLDTMSVGDRAIDALASQRAGVVAALLDGPHLDEVPDGTDLVPNLAAVPPLMSESWAERMRTGRLYHARDDELVAARLRAATLLHEIGLLPPADQAGRAAAYRELFGRFPEGSEIVGRFHCDYGTNIVATGPVFLNTDCVILDVAPVALGAGAMLGPAVQLITATHPMDAAARVSGLEYGRPITIGEAVWIGAGAIVLPGVTVGDRAVIGAGAVVTRDVAADAVIAGSPARPVR